MLSAPILLALATAVAAAPQGVTSAIPPPVPIPSGCSTSTSDTFQITVVNVTQSPKKRDLEKRDALTLTLVDGILKDALGRTGYIADNYQFQFDGPPQAGALFTSGFSLCGNKSLALGGSAVWYQCLSGGFYNLYDRSWAPQCSPIYIEALGGSPPAIVPTASVSQGTDGQVIATTEVSQRTDGQVIATTGTVVSQISDGQIQNPATAAPTTVVQVSQASDGQVIASPVSTAAVQQMSDGQIVATPQAPAAAVTEKTDGQPVALVPTSAATSAPAAPVSQSPDGQVVAVPTTSVASNGTVATPSPTVSQFPGAAGKNSALVGTSGIFALVVAIFVSLL